MAARKKTSVGYSLCAACVAASLVEIFYLLSYLLVSDYFLMSLFSSLYFVSVDLLLIGLLVFIFIYTKQTKNLTLYKIIFALIIGYAAFDIAVMLINPFNEVALTYVHPEGDMIYYAYRMHLLYELPLAFTYVLVILCLAELIKKTATIPHAYRRQYLLSVFGIVAVVGVNVVYLIFQSIFEMGTIDYSIWMYSITAAYLYWNCFHYPRHGMASTLSSLVMSSMDSGVLLFDHENNLTLSNKHIKRFFPDINTEKGLSFKAFLEQSGIEFDTSREFNTDFSFIYYSKGPDCSVARCDFKIVKSFKGEAMGKLMVFSEAESRKDLLTGFIGWESFKESADSGALPFKGSPFVVVCDINKKKKINNIYGKN
ncbi:MAG: hypothetical protein MJ091_06750, partial [Clostridia bacterium]|nr:hypothetical protein [Clostridia bacterium]